MLNRWDLMNLLTRLFTTRKPEPSNFEMLRDLLGSPQVRESVLGVQKASRPTPEELASDVHKAYAHTNSEQYKVWAQRVWAELLPQLDKVLDPRTPVDQLQFYRGAIASSLKLLRVSYEIVAQDERLRKMQAASVPSAPR